MDNHDRRHIVTTKEGGKSIMNQLRSLREFNLAMKELIVRQQGFRGP